jgi:hypothetical protein
VLFEKPFKIKERERERERKYERERGVNKKTEEEGGEH